MGRTVREIAEAAGVSPATVSRVINGSGGVAPEKRARILAELERLGAPQRSRSTRRRGETIGMLLLPGSEGDPRVIVNKLAALVERLPHRWNLQLLPAGILPLELESRHLHGELAGLILAGHGGGSPELAEVLTRIPHVWLNSHQLREGGHSVLMGNEFAGRIAARYLLDSGCRNPLVLAAPSINPGFASRIEGFRFEFFARETECRRLDLHPPREFELCTPAELEPLLLAAFVERVPGRNLFAGGTVDRAASPGAVPPASGMLAENHLVQLHAGIPCRPLSAPRFDRPGRQDAGGTGARRASKTHFRRGGTGGQHCNHRHSGACTGR